MKREEAINMLIKDKEQRGECLISDALDMAIHALEQEPCEDAISRQEALGCCRNEWEEEVEIRLKSLPSVNPQPKTGRWIDTNNLDVKYKAIYMCSNCRSCYTEMKPINMNFCPNCGARMESEEKND